MPILSLRRADLDHSKAVLVDPRLMRTHHLIPLIFREFNRVILIDRFYHYFKSNGCFQILRVIMNDTVTEGDNQRLCIYVLELNKGILKKIIPFSIQVISMRDIDEPGLRSFRTESSLEYFWISVGLWIWLPLGSVIIG